MKLLISRNIKIAAVVAIFGISFTFLIVAYQIQSTPSLKFPACNESWCLNIYGNTNENYVDSIGISYLENNGTFTYVSNQHYQIVNQGTVMIADANFSGVALDSIFKKTNIVNVTAQYLVFWGSDGYPSFKLPISVVMDHPGSVLIANLENNQPIPSKQDGGYGPIESVVPLSILQGNSEVLSIFKSNGQSAVYNSVYWCHYISAIQII